MRPAEGRLAPRRGRVGSPEKLIRRPLHGGWQSSRRPETTKGAPASRPAPPSGRAVLLGGSLQLAAGADLDAIARLDLDRLTGLPVAARASGAVSALDGEPARNGDLGALSHRGGQGREKRVKYSVDGSLAQARLGSDSCDQLGTVQ